MTRPARLCLLAAALLSPLPAWAHPGHLADVAGHDHWLGAAAIGAAIAIGLWKALRDRARAGEAAEETAEDGGEELQEA